MDDLWILRSVPTSSSEADCVPVKKTILQKWLQTVLVFESVLSFADVLCTGVLCNYQPPLNHQWKKCHSISNHCERDFIFRSQ